MSLTVMGMKVQVAPTRYRYQLPREIMPGLPWPDDFREDINRWARQACGSLCIVPDGQVLFSGDTIIVNERTLVSLKSALEAAGALAYKS